MKSSKRIVHRYNKKMSAPIVYTIRTDISFRLSGRTDLNRRPLQPHCSALAKLGHAPLTLWIIHDSANLARLLRCMDSDRPSAQAAMLQP